MAIEVAGTAIGFRFKNGGFGAAVSRRYSSFSAARWRYLVLAASAAGSARPFRPSVSADGEGLRIARGDFRLDLDRSARAGALFCAPRLQAFDSFLRTFYSSELPRRGGLLLHAAGLVRGGRAYVFPGVSGAGKSTLSRLAARRGLTLLSDELLPVRRAGGRWYAYGSPFWGEMKPGRESRRFPLAGVFKLSKAGANALRPLAAGELVRLLLRCAMNFSRDGADAARLLELAALLAAEKNGGELRFCKDGPGCFDLL